MGTWTTAVSDLQTLLNDQPDDRYCYRKRVFGDINGTNVNFKTFEFRRQTNFASAGSAIPPLGVYLNGTILATSAVASDDVTSGEFVLNAAPTDGQVLEATYYYQWFLVTELQAMLVNASRWLQNGEDYTTIPDGLNQGALYFAGKLAMEKMALKYSTRASNTFLLEDQPKKDALSVAETYSKQAADFMKSAVDFRDDYYTRSGQSLAAFSTSSFGMVSGVTPRR
jgi:hypothetical protein